MKEQPEKARLRTVPVQARARRTVQTLLDAARELLVEAGPEGLTTAALAKHTGLHVRNVYRYFPNRFAIIAALAEGLNEQVEEAVGDLGGLADPESDWRKALHELIERLLAVAGREPAVREIRASMQASVELMELERASDQRIADAVAKALEKRGVAGGRKHLRMQAFVLITALGAVMDRVLAGEEVDWATGIREVTRLAESYMGSVLEGRG